MYEIYKIPIINVTKSAWNEMNTICKNQIITIFYLVLYLMHLMALISI